MTHLATFSLALAALLARAPQKPADRIEGLDAPKAQPVPRLDDDAGQLDDELEEKRAERRRRERESRPPVTPFAKKREIGLLQDTLQHHERSLLIEVSVAFGYAQTSGRKEGYTMDPTSHFNVFWRQDAKRTNGRVGLWYGVRVAPFAGTGFYKKKPGTYGSTYFGPMIGVGKIDPVPEDDGSARATSASGEVEIPSASGWVATAGVAAVNKTGRREDGSSEDPADDFSSKGVAFDAPGIWGEARYLHVAYGALGVDAFLGVQTGADKLFVYGGVGVGGWN